ncbi:MAG: leucine-rich repeat domain-containing protein [Treponema sp.]|nr:leucine-rich repeat domain-containing protein [Treponema sp.]
MKRKWTLRVIAVLTLAVFIMLGLACASGPNPRYETEFLTKDGLFSYRIRKIEIWNDRGSRIVKRMEEISLIKYHGDSAEIVIPETIDDIVVTRIAAINSNRMRGFDNFARNKNISSIYIPKSIEYIGNYAFADNPLSSVIIYGKITDIDPDMRTESGEDIFKFRQTIFNRYIFGDFSGYYYLNEMKPGNYTKVNNDWFYNDNLLPFHPVDFQGGNNLTIIAINGVKISEKEVYIQAGVHSVTVRYSRSTTSTIGPSAEQLAFERYILGYERATRPTIATTTTQSAEYTFEEQAFISGTTYKFNALQNNNTVSFWIENE